MTGDVQVPDGDRDVEAVDLDAVESRRQVMHATAGMGEALGRNAAIRNQLILEMGNAAGRSANDVPALVAEVRRLRAALASQPAQSGDGVAEAVEKAWDEGHRRGYSDGYDDNGNGYEHDPDVEYTPQGNPYRIARTTTEEADHG